MNLCCRIPELSVPFLSQIALRRPYRFNVQVNGSSILQNVCGLIKIWDRFVKKRTSFFLFRFWGVFEANSNKKMQLYLPKRLLDTGISHLVIVEHLNHYMQGSCSKIIQKLAENPENLKHLSFLHIWGNSEETLS